MNRHDTWEELAQLGDEEIPLLRATLLIARDEYPDLDIAEYESRCAAYSA